jgi:hypothetical protein
MSVERYRREWRDRARAALAAHPEVARQALQQGFAVTVAQLVEAGVSSPTARRKVRAGRWSRPRRGVVAIAPRTEGTRATLEATAAALTCRGTICGLSAVAVYGLPLLRMPARAHLIGRLPLDRPSVYISPGRLSPSETWAWYGAPITAPARTLIDTACRDRWQGLVAADAALAAGLVTTDALAAALVQRDSRPGLGMARRVLGLATPLAESPLESLTRLCLHDAAIPLPEPQVDIVDGDGVWVARVDGLWRERRVVLESDGRVKYDGDALWREKLRQERLERLGFRVVRVTWSDVVDRPRQTADRVRWALGMGGLRTA